MNPQENNGFSAGDQPLLRGLTKGVAMALVGVDEVDLPKWTAIDQRVADAGLWRTVKTLPANARIVIGLAVRASRTLGLLTGLLKIVTGCVTAFGLLATANVLSVL